MKKLEKLKLNVEQLLNQEELVSFRGGSCPSGQFDCTCNGTDYGCVSSIQACWDKC